MPYQVIGAALPMSTNYYLAGGEYGTGQAVYPVGALVPSDIPAATIATWVAAGKVVQVPDDPTRLRVVAGPVTVTSWRYSDWTRDGRRLGTKTCQTGELLPADVPVSERATLVRAGSVVAADL